LIDEKFDDQFVDWRVQKVRLIEIIKKMFSCSAADENSF